MRRREPSVGGREFGIEFDRTPQKFPRLGIRLLLVSPPELPAAQEAVESLHAVGLLGRHPLPVALREVERQGGDDMARSEEHTSELQSRENLVCRLLLEK